MKRAILLILAASLLAGWALADWPSGGGYQLRWGATTNGGTETEPRVASGLKLSDNLGSNSYTADSFLTDGTEYINRPGYRKVEWDERKPISSVDDMGADTISSSPTFVITWGGADTTIADGFGWGIRYFDVDFRRGVSGDWTDWLDNTTVTSAIFGPEDPDTVFEDTTYYFRCRAFDLAGNTEDTAATWQAWARYEEQTLEWVVYNLSLGDDWTIDDSVSLNSTITAEAGDVFIVKNEGMTDIDIGVKGNPSTGWSLEDATGIDEYALRARFDDNATPPVTFEGSDAVIDTGFTWATAALYGPGGINIAGSGASGDSTAYTDNLWLQLRTPTDVTVFDYEQTIRIDLKAKASTP